MNCITSRVFHASLRTAFTKPAVFLSLLFAFLSSTSYGQWDSFEKDRTRGMLSNIKKAIEKNYYDPSFHGVNLEEKFKAADEKIKAATSLGQAYGIIGQTLIDLNDSHTFFIPPQRSAKIEYGWKMSIIGDKAFITAVKPGSDADKKGLKVGDEVFSVNGFRPTRSEMWKLNYYYYQISPRSAMRLSVRSPGGEQRELEISAKVTTLSRLVDLNQETDISDLIREIENESMRRYHRLQTVGNITVWKMPGFSFNPAQADEIMQGRVKKGAHLILDLRGNAGGYVKTLEKLAGYFFDKDVKIADVKRRKESEVSMAKSPGAANVFSGQVVILIDSQSGSAAEMFAKLMQIEKRGYVIGDRSAGAVMQARFFPMQMGTEKVVFYGASITDADVIATDGKSLERVGVTPDETVLLTGEDLAKSRDTVMSRAVEKLGGKVSPEDAGKFFPIEWDN
jgi:C-terminal processing protease CtpA/Prc